MAIFHVIPTITNHLGSVPTLLARTHKTAKWIPVSRQKLKSLHAFLLLFTRTRQVNLVSSAQSEPNFLAQHMSQLTQVDEWEHAYLKATSKLVPQLTFRHAYQLGTSQHVVIQLGSIQATLHIHASSPSTRFLAFVPSVRKK
ncbi:hypothetical protein MPER_05025, partial [Moniliophthora perniciosa FA553]